MSSLYHQLQALTLRERSVTVRARVRASFRVPTSTRVISFLPLGLVLSLFPTAPGRASAYSLSLCKRNIPGLGVSPGPSMIDRDTLHTLTLPTHGISLQLVDESEKNTMESLFIHK